MTPAAGNNDGEAFQTTVFIATSLDTHLVTMVSASDTVSDFKKKIMSEHRQCFPAIGNIKIHSLKVKRREVFYHLSDSMLVKNAFGNTKGNWFMSVDASSIEQDIDIQHIDKRKADNRLALPWVTHNGLISKNVDGGSCKDVSKNLKEDRSSDDKQLVINKEINSKKRARDVSNDNLLNDPSECGLSVKKKRKTQRVKSHVKGSEETMVLTYDNNDKVKDSGVSINDENTFEHKLKDKDLIEPVADVAIVAEKNNQHEMSEKEKESEPVHKAAMENEIPSSPMRTSECERDAAGLTVVGPPKGRSKRSTKHKAAEEEVASTSFIKKLQNITKDALDSSQQAVGSNGQDSRGVLIYKHMEDIEFPLKQGPEVKLTERRKKVKKSAAKIKKETLVMHADDAATSIDALHVDCVRNDGILSNNDVELLGTEKRLGEVQVENVDDISEVKLPDRRKKVKKSAVKVNKETTSVNAPVLDEKVIGEKSEVLETTSVDGIKKNTRKKKTKKSASRNEDESITKHVNGEIFYNVTKGDSNMPDGGREDEQQLYDGLTGKAKKKKKNKSSLAGPRDRLSKRQSTEAELESKKSQSVDHRQLPEDTSKNVTGSEVSKVNNEVCITNDGSSEINFMDHFAPGHKSKKTNTKTKDDSRNSGAIRSRKIISKNENNKAVTDPNIDDESSSSSKSFGGSYHRQKSNKQQSVAGPVKKNLPAVNSLLNTRGNIFGDDESDRSSADDNAAAVNSDSSTRTPSRKLTSSSGESDSSIDSRRNRSFAVKRKGGGKVSRASENKSKKGSMADLLRSSSRFKKAKFTASQQVDDTESQPVDFVPDSQPLG
ncbi:hypothetical protein HanPI659440_Chr08g0279651 [Helianthus annuus]|nr:hypothetical protein HanPI659440_Chr08g0279651 [Helianthus annuus]